MKDDTNSCGHALAVLLASCVMVCDNGVFPLPFPVRSLMLNADVVTQFNPHLVEQVGRVVEDCQACVMQLKSLDVQADTDHTQSSP